MEASVKPPMRGFWTSNPEAKHAWINQSGH